MPKLWLRSAEQTEYLDALLPRFAQARQDQLIARFNHDLCKGWFERWPEEPVVFGKGWKEGDSMTDDDRNRLGDAIKIRKEVGFSSVIV